MNPKDEDISEKVVEFKQLSNAEQAVNNLEESLIPHINRDRWICVVGSINDEGKVDIARVNFDFPTNQVLNFIATLASNISLEMNAPKEEPAPLAMPGLDELRALMKAREDNALEEVDVPGHEQSLESPPANEEAVYKFPTISSETEGEGS